MTDREYSLVHTGGRESAGLQTLLHRRRTIREFASRPIRLHHLADLMWAAQGQLPDGRRVTASAHRLYLLSVTAVVGNVAELPAGTYRYDNARDGLRMISPDDRRRMVADTTIADLAWLPEAGALLIVAGDLSAANAHFAEQPPEGRRGERYVRLEAGHTAQNVYLQAAESGLGAVLVGGFHDDRLLAARPPVLPVGHHPLCIIAVGHPA
ncbi:SagB/ThcOx family dehydrogenase [Nocardia flavorosea]|uniref:SagB/ThcOx family dehydrogenase n=1 Tax=Nocardia flavorosea TaxID=53429 RepID=A0A846YSJ4_9NOCA|nr:SagB/ThcOx family dehydrogenase [Nocardia flavorosea]NKY60272.1 SagB/ThcOx family dehydrogenase [Nocardia flavorosea]